MDLDHIRNHIFQEVLHSCQNPNLQVRLSALETIEAVAGEGQEVTRGLEDPQGTHSQYA